MGLLLCKDKKTASDPAKWATHGKKREPSGPPPLAAFSQKL